MAEFWVYMIVVLSTIFGANASMFLKLASRKIRGIRSMIFNNHLIAGLFLFMAAALLMIFALKFGELSKLFPVTALTYVWVAILSSKILKEKITREKLAAFILIAVGILFVAN